MYTIQVSDHPGAGKRVPSDEASKSWKTVYDGPIASSKEAIKAIDALSQWHTHVRSFKGTGTIGKMFYAVLRMKGD